MSVVVKLEATGSAEVIKVVDAKPASPGPGEVSIEQ